MGKQHQYQLTVKWTGNTGKGTTAYRDYERSHVILADHKAEIAGSSDPAFRGDRTKHNPEELFLASLSTCHMLMYLHLCADAGVIVTGYTDRANGILEETADGGGHFTHVTLNPEVTVREASMIAKANELHHKANSLCFIAGSCNFPVGHVPVCRVENA